MKLKIEELPVTFETASASVRKTRWGAMDVAVVQAAAGSTAPIIPTKTICPSEHWGLVLEGQMIVTYSDGRSEELSTGDAFYMEAGHTAMFVTDTRFLEITPAAVETK